MHKSSNKKRKIQKFINNEKKDNNFLNVANNDKIKSNNEKLTRGSTEREEYTQKKSNKSKKKQNSSSKLNINEQNEKKESEHNTHKKKEYNRININNNNNISNNNKKNKSNIKPEKTINNKDIKRNGFELNCSENIIKDNEIIKNSITNNNEKKKSKHHLIKSTQKDSLLLNSLSSLEENKLYVKNIDENIKKEDLEEFFVKATGYIDTRIVYGSKGKPKNFAYVEFDNNENAVNFLNTIENSDIDGYKKFNIKNVNLFTCISNPKKSLYEEDKVFIKFTKCDKENDLDIKEIIKEFFSNHSIVIKDIRLLGGNIDKYGYIELENNNDVIKCVENIKICELKDIEFNLNYSIPIIKKNIIYDLDTIKLNKEKNKKLKDEKKREENSCIIVVKNLHFNTRKNKLEKFFEQIGEIENIYLSKKISENNIKRNKGFAYITFKNANDATSALILNDSVLDGRNILISKYSDSIIKKFSGYKISNFNKNIYTYEKKKKDKNYVNENYYHEKKRINLSKSTDHVTEKNFEKGSDYTNRSMTNEDFRKLFIK